MEIHAYGVWVACIRLSEKEPYILLADHIERKDLMLIYRVDNLDKASSEFEQEGGEKRKLGGPSWPLLNISVHPADNSIAIYENRRPHVMRDFKRAN